MHTRSRSGPRQYVLWALLSLVVAAPASAASLRHARELGRQLNYADAIKELRELENDPALSAAKYLDTLELEGIAQGSLKQKG